MENLIKQQSRVSFSGPGQDFSKNAREQGTASSKGEKRRQNWFWRQMNSQTSHEDNELGTAIAASAFAIYCLGEEEAHSNYSRRSSQGFKPPTPPISRRLSVKETKGAVEASSMRKRMGQNDKAPTLRTSPLATATSPRGISAEITKANAWEKAELAKIMARYEKTNSTILTWENEKKLRAKRQMERKKAEVDQMRTRNSQHYQAKIARIEDIAAGARAQVEDKRKNDESKVKDKAKMIRSTGNIPISCYCF